MIPGDAALGNQGMPVCYSSAMAAANRPGVEGVEEVEGVNHLYEVKPGQFVAARDQLARQLKASGDREAATAVKALRRPTVVAWAVNQVVRSQPEALDELEEATSVVQRAQEAAVGGDPDGPGELREAARRRRELLSTLARAATDLAGPAHQDQVTATIDAGTLDPDAAPHFRRGRLTTELSAPAGFGPDATSGPVWTTAVPPPRPPPPPSSPLVDLDRLRDEVARAEEAVILAAEEVERADDVLARAQSGLESARAELDGALRRRDRARAALGEAGRTDAAGRGPGG